MKVLVVDDNIITRGMIKDLLEELGHVVAGEAEDGDSAVKAFAALRPDVVFLDLIMPGKSGAEVFEEIRAIDPQAKVVIVTAVDQEKIDKKIFEKGVKAVIRKPFSYDEFADVLKGLA